MRKQGLLDAANLIKAEKIIARYGYPGKTLVGPNHQSTLFLVIQHNDTEVHGKYLQTAPGLRWPLRNSGTLRFSIRICLI